MVHAIVLARRVDEIDAQELSSCPELFMIVLPRAWGGHYPAIERVREGGGRVLFRIRTEPRRSARDEQQLLPGFN